MKSEEIEKAWENELKIFRKNKDYPADEALWNRFTVERWLKKAFLAGYESRNSEIEELFNLVDGYRKDISESIDEF